MFSGNMVINIKFQLNCNRISLVDQSFNSQRPQYTKFSKLYLLKMLLFPLPHQKLQPSLSYAERTTTLQETITWIRREVTLLIREEGILMFSFYLHLTQKTSGERKDNSDSGKRSDSLNCQNYFVQNSLQRYKLCHEPNSQSDKRYPLCTSNFQAQWVLSLIMSL